MLRVADLSKRLEIHTSDRILYKRCRRKWDWSSQMRNGYVSKEGTIPIHFWFGSGFHYAMEDFFGYNRHGGMYEAYLAYVDDFPLSERPNDWEDTLPLIKGMFDHYQR